jgi:hypothetical protein
VRIVEVGLNALVDGDERPIIWLFRESEPLEVTLLVDEQTWHLDRGAVKAALSKPCPVVGDVKLEPLGGYLLVQLLKEFTLLIPLDDTATFIQLTEQAVPFGHEQLDWSWLDGLGSQTKEQ